MKRLVIFMVGVITLLTSCVSCGCNELEVEPMHKTGYVRYTPHFGENGEVDGTRIKEDTVSSLLCKVVYEFEFDGHKFLYFQDGGVVHSHNCWCMKTNRDTVVIQHKDTIYMAIPKDKLDRVIRNSIEKNMSVYFKKLLEEK